MPVKRLPDTGHHNLVDTQGLVLQAKVHSATVMDRDGSALLLPIEETKEKLPRMKHVWLDSGDNGQDKAKEWIEQNLGWTAEIVRHPPRPRGVWTTLSADEIDWSKILPPSGCASAAAPMGRGTNVFVVWTKSENE